MAVSIPSDASGHHQSELTAGSALRRAWYWYISLLFVPFAMFVAVLIDLNRAEGTAGHWRIKNGWFIGAIAFLIVATPIAFWIRSRFFRSYWRGEVVSPRHYLTGMLILWLTFEAGGLLSLLGCFVSNSLLPCLLPAIAAFLFFLPLWPNGRAMTRPRGNSDDPEIYSEPR
ncbi:MAG TPA: hypothetical protein VFC78_13030 [Tepidisphaeraceae bacterium]|nr:hypothetical protein [Tepidisphaeraceae bacterium]